MSRTLYLALPPLQPLMGSAFDFVLSDDGRTVLQQGRALTGQLPQADALCLLVPAQLLSWHAVRLPPGSTSRAPLVLAGMLEDRLLDDPATLAFALAPQANTDGTRSVAVLDKAWLRGALDWFEQHGRTVARVVPLHAPAGDALAGRCLVVHGTPKQARLVLIGAQEVLSLPLEAAPTALAALGDSGALPLFVDPALAELAGLLLGRSGAARDLSAQMLLAARSQWELAQFELAMTAQARFARRTAKRWNAFWRDTRWRPLRWGVLVLLLANVAGLNAWAWRLEANLQAKRQQAKATLLQSFPGVRSVVDAPLQMERELALLRRASGALARADLEAMLAAAGSVFPAGAGAGSIEFAGGELTLTGGGLTPSLWPLASAKLAQAGYNARLDGERLQLRRGAGP